MASAAEELFVRAPAPRPARLAPAALLTWPMAATFALLASTPLWLGAIGLYQYLALEIVIWMLFALGYNLLLGHAGLPSFGHGAYFGVGAYGVRAGAEARRRQPLARPRPRGARRGPGRRDRRRVHLAPARDLLRPPHHRVRTGVLVRGDQVAQRHGGRGWPPQPQAPAGRLRVRKPQPRLQRGALLLRVRGVRAGGGRPVAARALAVRPHPARGEAERDARGVRGPQRVALQVARVRDLRRDRRASPARSSRWRSSPPIRT